MIHFVLAFPDKHIHIHNTLSGINTMVKTSHYSIVSSFLFFFFCANIIQSQELTIDKITVVETGKDETLMNHGSSTGTIKPLFYANAPSLTPNDDLFGIPGGGHVHPFFNISGEYTDNLFNIQNNEKNNFLTRISPGIWLAIPSSKEIPITIIPNNTSAGGLQRALKDTKEFDRINAYILGALDFNKYSESSALNDHDARVEGLFQINLRGGLSFRAVDRFTRDHDLFGRGSATADNLRKYYSNIALADLDWNFSEKFRTKIEYSNFSLDYSEDINNDLDRKDNSISWYGYYDYSTKTSLLLEYQYITTRYDNAEIKDNNNSFIYAGIDWTASDKTFLHVKAGYQQKKFTNDVLDDITEDTDGLALELTMDYRVTQKTNMGLTLSHKTDESDTSTALDKKVSRGAFIYRQRFTERLLGRLHISYENDDYMQVRETDRDDDRYIIRPSIQYAFRDWLMAELAYTYDTRNSTDNIYDYTANTIFFSLNSAL